MNLPGMLVEYLVNGIYALLWCWVLWGPTNSPSCSFLPQITAQQLALLVPVAYILGMLIDSAGAVLVFGIERIVRNIRGKPAAEKLPEYVDIFFKSPELAKQIEMRSSRERVARGALTSTALAGIFLAIAHIKSKLSSDILLGIVVLALALLGLWLRFYIISLNFAANALETISKEARLEGTRKGA